MANCQIMGRTARAGFLPARHRVGILPWEGLAVLKQSQRVDFMVCSTYLALVAKAPHACCGACRSLESCLGRHPQRTIWLMSYGCNHKVNTKVPTFIFICIVKQIRYFMFKVTNRIFDVKSTGTQLLVWSFPCKYVRIIKTRCMLAWDSVCVALAG